MLRIDLMDWPAARAAASPIRMRVFVDEQRVPAQIELDEHDAASIHALAYATDGTAIATGRLLPDGHIGRMAVLSEWRGKGVGGEVLARLMARAQQRGDRAVVLSAQVQAIAFYRRHGFVEEGSEFLEAGIRHQQMRRTL